MDRYEIQVAGHLDQRRARALGCDELRLLPGGASLIGFQTLSSMYDTMGRFFTAGVRLAF